MQKKLSAQKLRKPTAHAPDTAGRCWFDKPMTTGWELKALKHVSALNRMIPLNTHNSGMPVFGFTLYGTRKADRWLVHARSLTAEATVPGTHPGTQHPEPCPTHNPPKARLQPRTRGTVSTCPKPYFGSTPQSSLCWGKSHGEVSGGIGRRTKV